MKPRYLTTKEAVEYLAARMPDPPTRRTLETWAKPSQQGTGDHPACNRSKSGRLWWSSRVLDAWAARMEPDWKGSRSRPGNRPEHPD